MYSYTTMDRVFSKLDRDVTNEFAEDDIIEWTGEALEAMQCSRAYEPFVAFIEIHNHQCSLPRGLHQIEQIARNNAWTGKGCKSMCPSTIAQCLPVASNSEEECKIVKGLDPCACPDAGAVWLDCHGQPIVAYDLAYYRPFFNLRLEAPNTFSNSTFYIQNYTPIRLSTNSMFNGLVCNPRPSPYNKSQFKDEYQIIAGKILRFSFKEGAIALSYKRQLVDYDTGYPKIPDSFSHLTAIIAYIREKILGKKEFGSRAHEKAEQNWQWYCGQASSLDKMPQGVDEYQNLLDQRSYILPNLNAYYTFFGNLNDPEQRMWNNRFHGTDNISRGEGVRVAGGSGSDDIVISNSSEIIEPTWEEKEW